MACLLSIFALQQRAFGQSLLQRAYANSDNSTGMYMRDPADLPIALFDSGVGGLTVLKEIARRLPAEDLLYLGDTARLPYGTKGPDTIIRYTLMASRRLVSAGVKMLVVACNTATSAALATLQETFAPLPVMGVVEPGANAAATRSVNGRILVIATEATIRGGAYQHAIARIRPDAKVMGKACTLFVPMAEEGWVDGPELECVAHRYLDQFFMRNPDEKPDTLLLGCTHFPLLKKALCNVVGDDVQIVDSAIATARYVHSELESRCILRRAGRIGRHSFMTTDNRERFARTGSIFMGESFDEGCLELIDL